MGASASAPTPPSIKAKRDTYNQLKTGSIKTLDQDKLTRISLLLGIFKALNNLYFEELEFADTWVTALNNNPIFGGKSPLIYMVQGGLPAIILVRQLLERSNRPDGPGPIVEELVVEALVVFAPDTEPDRGEDVIHDRCNVSKRGVKEGRQEESTPSGKPLNAMLKAFVFMYKRLAVNRKVVSSNREFR